MMRFAAASLPQAYHWQNESFFEFTEMMLPNYLLRLR